MKNTRKGKNGLDVLKTMNEQNRDALKSVRKGTGLNKGRPRKGLPRTPKFK